MFLAKFYGHFVHEAVRRKVILSAMVLEDHTANYLASKLQSAITTSGLEQKIHVGVCDNAANMISAMRCADVADISCMAHTLQLVLRDGLFTQSSVENACEESTQDCLPFQTQRAGMSPPRRVSTVSGSSRAHTTTGR